MIEGPAPLELFEEIDSTMLEARRRAERGELCPLWLIARAQTAGRGRRGRAWASGEGNLMATLLFVTKRPPAEIALLGFAAGVAIAETIEAMGGAGRVGLKWPNDVMIDGAKAAGVLIDSGAAADGGLWVALSCGVNLAAAPNVSDQPTSCLHAALPAGAATPPPLEFFAAMRPRLEAWSALLAAQGFEPLRQAWLSRAHGLGCNARVRQGEHLVEGRIAGISARGELEFETQAGRKLIAAGDVFFSSAA
jgi:BirA family transcriptional regulator, biotin operon repressor / biotin---[acetyl-CoA-carboxylase] ligase